jgi:hypothetical protein
MGASALWCLNALNGNFEYDPVDNLARAMDLTRAYVSFGKSDAAIRQHAMGPTLIDQHYLNHRQERNMLHLLHRVGVTSTIVPNPGYTRNILRTLTTNEGIYMVCIATHITGLSSIEDNYYFYDNQAALYHCDSPEELKDCIEQARGPGAGCDTRDELDAPNENTYQFGWSAARCIRA